jgi:hypothetical protein
MNPAAKYALGIIISFGLGATASHYVTMHYIGKYIDSTFKSFEALDAVLIIQALDRIRDGNTESAIVVLENHMGTKLIPIANPKRNISELSESEIKASKMAVEYWNKFPDAKGKDLIRSEVENIAHGK